MYTPFFRCRRVIRLGTMANLFLKLLSVGLASAFLVAFLIGSQSEMSQRTNGAVKNKLAAGFPIIYVITPTYRRPEQIAELTRLAQTLLHVSSIHWIVVEDANSTSLEINRLLRRYGIPFTHLRAPMPLQYRNMKPYLPRGVSNRNAGLNWIRCNVKSGVVYFADDDNTYDIRLFDEMRYTQKISMWPVGLVGSYGFSSPLINSNGTVEGFVDGWIGNRKFPVDMASFAINVQLLIEKPNVAMPYTPGYEEDGFLKSLDINYEDIQPRASNCSQILVWHTKAVRMWPSVNIMSVANSVYNGTNIDLLETQIWSKHEVN